MHEGHNPYADLVEFSTKVTKESLKKLEYNQLGATRRGGSLKELLDDVHGLGIKTKILREGRLSDFKKEEYSFEYRLISGNY